MTRSVCCAPGDAILRGGNRGPGCAPLAGAGSRWITVRADLSLPGCGPAPVWPGPGVVWAPVWLTRPRIDAPGPWTLLVRNRRSGAADRAQAATAVTPPAATCRSSPVADPLPRHLPAGPPSACRPVGLPARRAIVCRSAIARGETLTGSGAVRRSAPASPAGLARAGSRPSPARIGGARSLGTHVRLAWCAVAPEHRGYGADAHRTDGGARRRRRRYRTRDGQ